jgi:hypothetical protein
LRQWVITGFGVVLIPLAFACGGGGGDSVKLPDGSEITVGGDLPDSFPDSFPIYDGSDLIGSLEGEQEGIQGTVATWETGDSYDDVKQFYDEAFADDPWTTINEGTSGDSAYWAVMNSSDETSGYVTVADGDKVTIIAIVGDDAASIADPEDEATPDEGSDDEATPDDGDSGSTDADLPDEVDLPNGFPSDKISLPDGARVTYATSITSNGVTSHSVILHSKDSGDDLADYFKSELEGNGFTQLFQSVQGDGVIASYGENADGTGLNVAIIIGPGEADGYQSASITVTTQ